MLRVLALSGREWCSASTPVTDNLQVPHEFRGTDGQGPTGAVTQWSDGWFYGVTGRRRRLRRGVLYSFSTAGLPVPEPP